MDKLTPNTDSFEFISSQRPLTTWGKIKAFFTQGLIGQSIKETTVASVAEVGASILGGYIVGSYLGEEGKKLGTLVGHSIIPIATAAAGAAILGVTSIPGQSLVESVRHKLKQVTLLKGVILIMLILTMVAAEFKLSHSLADSAVDISQGSCQFIGSFIGSVIGGYAISCFTSKLSFRDYLQRNLQQTALVSYMNFYSPTSFLASIPRDIIYGALAYNAGPIYNSLKSIMMLAQSERKDLALRIKHYINNSHKEAVEEAKKALEEAQRKNQDTKELSQKLADLNNRSLILTQVFDNLDTLLRIGFRTFNDYQRILSSESVVLAQEHLVNVYQEPDPENSEDIFYDAPEEIITPDSILDLDRETKKAQARAALVEATAQEIGKQYPFKSALLAPLLRNVSKDFVLPHLANIPDIPDLEKMLLGFSITDSQNSELAQTLIAIHMQQFIALAGFKLFDNVPLDKDDDLNLVQDILGLVTNHYLRLNPQGKIVKAVNTTLDTVFTGLREGPRAAFNQLRAADDFEQVSDDEIEEAQNSEDEFFDALQSMDEDYEMLTPLELLDAQRADSLAIIHTIFGDRQLKSLASKNHSQAVNLDKDLHKTLISYPEIKEVASNLEKDLNKTLSISEFAKLLFDYDNQILSVFTTNGTPTYVGAEDIIPIKTTIMALQTTTRLQQAIREIIPILQTYPTNDQNDDAIKMLLNKTLQYSAVFDDFTIIDMPLEETPDHTAIVIPPAETAQKTKSLFSRFLSFIKPLDTDRQ